MGPAGVSYVTSSEPQQSEPLLSDVASTQPAPRAATGALPTPVHRAVLLMLVGAGLSALNALVALTLRDRIRAGIEDHGRKFPRDRLSPVEMDQAATTTMAVLVISGVVATLVWLAMAWLNRRGRWWARIGATVLTLFCVLQTWSFLTRGHPTALAAVLSLLVLGVGLAAAALLWHPDSAEHFTPTKGTDEAAAD